MKKLKPETEEEKRLQQTPGGMRILMMRHARESPLLRAVDTSCTMFRMTDLDRYTTLAYHALLALEKTQELFQKYAEIHPSPFVLDMPVDRLPAELRAQIKPKE